MIIAYKNRFVKEFFMKIELIGERKIVMQNERSKHNYFAWPTVARLGDGRIAVGASGFRIDHICPFGKSVICYSDDEGESYTIPQVIVDTCLDQRDTGLLAVDEKTFILTTFNNSVAYQRRVNERRTDGMCPLKRAYIKAYLETVTPEEEVNSRICSSFSVTRDGGKSFSDNYPAPVTSPHGPMKLSDGRIIWVGAHFPNEGGIAVYEINIDDGSASYISTIDTSIIANDSCNACEPYAIESTDGRILCFIRADSKDNWKRKFTIYQCESSDGGRTFSEPRQIFEDRGGGPAHVMRHSSGALIISTGLRDKPFGIRVARSLDEGRSWEAPELVYTAEYLLGDWITGDRSCDIGYPSTVELKDGSLLTVFYAYPKDCAHAVIMQQRWKIVE